DALGILIGGNIGEVAFTLASTAMTGRSALNTRQFLLVNLMTDLLPAITIATRPPREKSPEELLLEGPEASLGRPLATQIALRAVTTSTATTAAWMAGKATGTNKRAGTIALATLVTTQLSQTAVLGGKSPVVLLSTMASAGVLGIVIQTPGVSQYFGCTPLDPVAWGVVGFSTFVATGASIALPYLLNEAKKRRLAH
ncbi:MAG: cation-translocating P-type ATPase, partial [Acidimicrobiales bacterium]|nr:cation-translocating P-type ATPase [Acidimicrobiales bacterium]